MVGKLNVKPASTNRFGKTNCPVSRVSANSPKTRRSMNSGVGMKLGRCKARPRARAQVPVAHRVGRGEVHRAGNLRIFLDEPEGPGEVGLVDPGEPPAPEPMGPPKNFLNRGAI